MPHDDLANIRAAYDNIIISIGLLVKNECTNGDPEVKEDWSHWDFYLMWKFQSEALKSLRIAISCPAEANIDQIRKPFHASASDAIAKDTANIMDAFSGRGK